MKRSMAILLVIALVFSALVFTACGGSGSKGMTFIKIADLKAEMAANGIPARL